MRKTIIFVVLQFSILTAWSQSFTSLDSVACTPSINQEENTTILTGNESTSFQKVEYSPITSKPDSLQLLPANSPTLKWYTMFERIPGDWVSGWNLTVRKDNIPTMLAITGLTAFAIATDHPVWDNSKKFYTSSQTSKDVSDFFVSLGDGKPQFGLSAALALYGFIEKDNHALLTASQITESVLACGTVIQVLKHITGRESPFVSTRRNGKWQFFPNQIQYHKHVPRYDAYPSGHIATTLATLTVVLENYPETKPWLRPIGYAIVGSVGVGLSNKGIHWWSDFPLGLYLGYQFGMIASHPEGLPGDSKKDGSSQNLSIGPSFTPTGSGISMVYQF